MTQRRVRQYEQRAGRRRVTRVSHRSHDRIRDPTIGPPHRRHATCSNSASFDPYAQLLVKALLLSGLTAPGPAEESGKKPDVVELWNTFIQSWAVTNRGIGPRQHHSKSRKCLNWSWCARQVSNPATPGFGKPTAWEVFPRDLAKDSLSFRKLCQSAARIARASAISPWTCSATAGVFCPAHTTWKSRSAAGSRPSRTEFGELRDPLMSDATISST
jgi:hypothetical protein